MSNGDAEEDLQSLGATETKIANIVKSGIKMLQWRCSQ